MCLDCQPHLRQIGIQFPQDIHHFMLQVLDSMLFHSSKETCLDRDSFNRLMEILGIFVSIYSLSTHNSERRTYCVAGRFQPIVRDVVKVSGNSSACHKACDSLDEVVQMRKVDLALKATVNCLSSGVCQTAHFHVPGE